MDVSDRDAILQKIAEAEKQLANLLRQKEEAEAELRWLRERLEKGDHPNAHIPNSASAHQASTVTPLTPDDKVALFLRLFRDRAPLRGRLGTSVAPFPEDLEQGRTDRRAAHPRPLGRAGARHGRGHTHRNDGGRLCHPAIHGLGCRDAESERARKHATSAGFKKRLGLIGLC